MRVSHSLPFKQPWVDYFKTFDDSFLRRDGLNFIRKDMIRGRLKGFISSRVN